MICLAIWRAVRCSPFVTSLLCLVTLFCAAGITVAAVVGDQVELKATHQAGVPLHQEPRGTNDLSVTKNRGSPIDQAAHSSARGSANAGAGADRPYNR